MSYLPLWWALTILTVSHLSPCLVWGSSSLYFWYQKQCLSNGKNTRLIMEKTESACHSCLILVGGLCEEQWDITCEVLHAAWCMANMIGTTTKANSWAKIRIRCYEHNLLAFLHSAFLFRLKDKIIFIPENVTSGVGGMILIKRQKEKMILTCCLFNITWLGCLEILLAHISYIISRTSVYTVSELPFLEWVTLIAMQLDCVWGF